MATAEYRILTVDLVVRADVPLAEVADGIHALLQEQGVCSSDDPLLRDWRYHPGTNIENAHIITASDPLDEGDAFRDL